MVEQSDVGRRIQIKLPEQYRSVDEEVWTDLESYLYQGFLVSPAYLFGKTFVFKTLNHHELRHIQYFKPLRTSAIESRESFRAVFIAHSLFMIDGENLLIGRSKRFPKLIRIIMKMTPEVQDKIMDALASLNERASRLHPLTEIYVHENRSRYRWMHSHHSPIHSVTNTGIFGTDEIGMNYCQQAWTALNNLLDTKEEMERGWTNAKFIGSCFAGKGVRSIDEKDRARKERERTEQEELKMKVLHAYLNRKLGTSDSEEVVELPNGKKAIVASRFRADSAQDLANQLSAALSGEKDHHDLIVEAQMEKVRIRIEDMEGSRLKIFQNPGFGSNKTNMDPNSGSRVLGGKDEADALISRLRGLQRDQLERYHRQIPGNPDDRENSDDDSSGNGVV
jgi:hypothetical protein